MPRMNWNAACSVLARRSTVRLARVRVLEHLVPVRLPVLNLARLRVSTAKYRGCSLPESHRPETYSQRGANLIPTGVSLRTVIPLVSAIPDYIQFLSEKGQIPCSFPLHTCVP